MRREQLANAIKSKGYTQKEFAQEVGISKIFLEQILLNVRNPKLETAKKILSKLDINDINLF